MRRSSPLVIPAMMPVMARVAIVTDAARAVIGPDGVATAVGVIIIGRSVIIGWSIEETPVVKEVPVMMPERESAMAITTAAKTIGGSNPAATNRRATATEAATVKHRAATMETTAAMEATATVETATTMAAAAVPTLHFG